MNKLQKNKQKLIALLQEIIDAGQGAKVPLDMRYWHCGTSCCLCGDLAVARSKGKTTAEGDELIDEWETHSTQIYNELLELSRKIFDSSDFSQAIISGDWTLRRTCAIDTKLFSLNELEHEHLHHEDHPTETAHDWVRLCIKKLEECQSA